MGALLDARRAAGLPDQLTAEQCAEIGRILAETRNPNPSPSSAPVEPQPQPGQGAAA